jgi:AcrR family transcriptional regulator
MKRVQKRRRVKPLQRFVVPGAPWSTPRGARGAAVIAAVTRAGLALLSEKRSRDVTVVEIAKRAGVARASLLLQFPGGMSDVLSAVINAEYASILEVDDKLWQARPPATPLAAMQCLIAAIYTRATSSGLLYANLLAESMMLEGEHREQVRATFGLLGLTFAARAIADRTDDPKVLQLDAIALGEVLARSVWASSIGTWAAQDLAHLKGAELPAALDLSSLLAEVLLPKFRALHRRPSRATAAEAESKRSQSSA